MNFAFQKYLYIIIFMNPKAILYCFFKMVSFQITSMETIPDHEIFQAIKTCNTKENSDPLGCWLCFIGSKLRFGIRACISISRNYNFFRISYALLPSKFQLQANKQQISSISTWSKHSWFSSPKRSHILTWVILSLIIVRVGNSGNFSSLARGTGKNIN